MSRGRGAAAETPCRPLPTSAERRTMILRCRAREIVRIRPPVASRPSFLRFSAHSDFGVPVVGRTLHQVNEDVLEAGVDALQLVGASRRRFAQRALERGAVLARYVYRFAG